MNFYDDAENVEAYLTMAEGYDGRELMPILRRYVPNGAAVLELGMGPGKDVTLMAEHYQVTGSDRSAVFVERYRAAHAGADVLLLDAVTLDTDRRFDAIYSNKVLYHLTRDEMRQSLARQTAVLREGGIAFHTLWIGEGDDEMDGLRFIYYTEETLADVIGPAWEIMLTQRYAEMEPEDSLIVVLRKRTATESIGK
jgi:ubiquinone/menaquinone biosynthesis C-methylase UbiE